MQAEQLERFGSLTRSACLNGSSKAIDDAARATLDLLAGRSLNDAELTRVGTKLLEFMIILRGWDQKAKNTSAGLGNVDSICQQGP
jgi:hypothetical protein